MPLESGTTIAQLDEQWPLSGDGILEGDNHIRLLKAVLKAQFPGSNADGFSEPITATEAELNSLVGSTGNIQDQLNDIIDDFQNTLYAPQGTVMLFYQASPPVGWTQVASANNSMLRLVTGSGGGSGGTDSPVSFDFDHNHTTGDVTLTEAQMPNHTHDYNFRDENNNVGKFQPNCVGSPAGGRGYQGGGASFSTLEIKNTGGGGPHNHGATGNTNKNFKPKYINVIAAVKD
jgi:hypothetical protein